MRILRKYPTVKRVHNKALIVLQADEGASFDVRGVRFVYKARSHDTDGHYAVTEGIVPPGQGAPMHIHHREDEAFYILEGSFEIECDGNRFTAGPGAFALLPKNLPHRFMNISPVPGKLLCIQSPGGVEEFFAHLSALAEGGKPDLDQVRLLTEKYEIEFIDSTI
jgi:mannose-6-phosphate isomerase-like protein (cupin superfamily)